MGLQPLRPLEEMVVYLFQELDAGNFHFTDLFPCDIGGEAARILNWLRNMFDKKPV